MNYRKLWADINVEKNIQEILEINVKNPKHNPDKQATKQEIKIPRSF